MNEELADIYRAWLKDHPFDNGGGGWAAEPWHQKEMVITEEIAAAAAEKSEKAIFIIGRTAGEDKDYANEAGSYLLTPEELENLKVLTAHFEQVAVLLNVSNIIDMSWLKNPVYKDHIRSVLYIWQGGMEWKCSCGCFEWKSVSKWKTDGHDRMFTGRLSGGERFRRHCAQFLHRRYLCWIPLF